MQSLVTGVVSGDAVNVDRAEVRQKILDSMVFKIVLDFKFKKKTRL